MNLSRFLNQLAEPITGEALFDHLADVVYFIKDANCAYRLVNRTLVERCGAKSKADLLGRTAMEMLGDPLGRQFTSQDELVLSTGRALTSQLELHLHRSGTVGWCLTTKLPLRDKQSHVVGLIGVSQDLRLPNYETEEYEQLARAIQWAENHLDSAIKIPELAARAKMSRYQLDRRMQYVFGLTAGQWLIKSRIDAARRLLQESQRSISQVALQVGYSDQSAFTRQFRTSTGLTPKQFRTASQIQVEDG